VSLDTTEATRPSFTGTATPERALVLVTTVECRATTDIEQVQNEKKPFTLR
jgi:hypothetical protein